MKRREFITLLGGDTATWFDAAHSAAFPSVHSHGSPTGAAATFMIRPTTTPSQSTSKPSSFHSPDGREIEARLRAR